MNRGTLASSLRWAFVMNWGQRGIATAATFVLAAILGPHDFGVVAIALIYIQFIQLFLEAGIATAVVQREQLEREHIDSAFWMNIALCLVLAGVSVALSGWWAGVNGTPELSDVIKVLSLLILIDGLVIVQYSLLQREMAFKKLAVRANVAAFAGAALGISLAVAGAGVWSLVAQSLVNELVALVLLWLLSPWRPGFRFSRRHARQLLGFSTSVFVANIGGFVNRRADALLLGVFFGPTAVGLYRLADRFVEILLELTMRPIGAVSLPLFSRLQSDRAGLRDAVGSCLRTTILVSVPPLLVLAACSDQIVRVLGEKWEAAGDPLKLLSVVGIAKALVFFTGPLLFAVSRARFRAVMLWSMAVVSALVAAVTGAALTGASIENQVLGMSLTRAALFVLVFIPVNWIIVARISGLGLRAVLPSLPGPLTAGAGAFLAVTGLEAAGVLDGLGPVLALLVSGTVAVSVAAALLVLIDRQVRQRAVGLLGRVLGRPGPAEAPATIDAEISTTQPKGVTR
jgi:O-antigen/teichoic acid export membrane protein